MVEVKGEALIASTITHNHSLKFLYWLDVQPGPHNLVSLNTREGHSPYTEPLSIGLYTMIVQFGPYDISFCHLIEDLYLYIWNRREEEAPVFPYPCLPGEVPLRVQGLLTAKVRSKTCHHSIQIVAIGGLYHALEYRFGDECVCAFCTCSWSDPSG
jgi:hypothetical protein